MQRGACEYLGTIEKEKDPRWRNTDSERITLNSDGNDPMDTTLIGGINFAALKYIVSGFSVSFLVFSPIVKNSRTLRL